jgi:hypothetical protein
MSRQTLSALVNRTDANQLPRASTIRKLAEGLGMPYDLVRSVAQETAYGDLVGPAHTRPVQVLIAYAERLPEWSVEVLLSTARALETVQLDPPDPTDPPPDGAPVAVKQTATRKRSKTGKASGGRLAVIR